MRIHAPNYTQTPNEFFDDIAKTLKEGELRVLLVIMRQTFGWQKAWDQISLSQLSNKTGLDRRSVMRSLKTLLEKKLITKKTEGKNGDQRCWYSLNVEQPKPDEYAPDNESDFEDSNNFDQGHKAPPTRGIKPPTKETPTKEIKKNTKKKAPAVPPISLNSETKKFEGIASEDLQRWQETYPAVNVRKELAECLIWALSAPRSNYRRSIDTWMRHKNTAHTTPFKTQNQGHSTIDESLVADEDLAQNSKLAHEWEKDYEKRKIPNYDIQAKENRVDFLLPNGESVSVFYRHDKKEFLKLCQSPAKRMRLPISGLSD